MGEDFDAVELCCAMVVACLMKNYQTNKGTAMVL
jgi:hypothetical protein